MKKLLCVFGSLGFLATTSSAVVACSSSSNGSIELGPGHYDIQSLKSVADFKRAVVQAFNAELNTLRDIQEAFRRAAGWPTTDIDLNDVIISNTDGSDLSEKDIKAHFKIKLTFIKKVPKKCSVDIEIDWSLKTIEEKKNEPPSSSLNSNTDQEEQDFKLIIQSPKTVADFKRAVIIKLNEKINDRFRPLHKNLDGWPLISIDESDVNISNINDTNLTKKDIKAHFKIKVKFINKVRKEHSEILEITWSAGPIEERSQASDFGFPFTPFNS